ncbi:MAG: hypothetical protein ACI4EL_03030 [Candidatus Fimimorpha sp.]
MKKWIIGCIFVMLVLSGCSLKMTTEEKLALYGGNSVQLTQGMEGIQIEQLASNQVPQLTTDLLEYPAELIGKIFLGLSVEETKQKVREYYEYLLREQNLTEEMAKEVGAGIALSKGDATVTCSQTWMTFKGFTNADRYALTVYTINRLYQPDISGVENPVNFHYRHLSSAFSDQELEGGTKEAAKAACDPIAGALGFFSEETEIYTMDGESMNRIQKLAKVPSLDTETDESGNIVGELKPWRTEQGAYLLLYKKGINGKIIESIASENILLLIYHPNWGLLFAEEINGVNGMNIMDESIQTVMSGEEAVAQAQLYFEQMDWTGITIVSAKLRYMAPFGNFNFTEKQMQMDPCWDIEYQYVENGIQLTDHILLHAVTGIVAVLSSSF